MTKKETTHHTTFTILSQLEMDCTESSCDTVIYETYPVRVVTSFVKISLNEKCTEGGIGGFREIRALSMVHDGKTIYGTCVLNKKRQ